jgi:pilus assembly protein CpaF
MFGKKPSDIAGFQPAAEPAPQAAFNMPPPSMPAIEPAAASHSPQPIAGEVLHYRDIKMETAEYHEARKQLISELLDQLDFQALETFAPAVKRRRVEEACDKILPKILLPLTLQQIDLIKSQAIDEILGFGPIQVLLNDPDVNDIMINGAQHVFIERAGKIYLTDVTFHDEKHLLGMIQRIVSRVGRRVDESSPMVDARMPDGSRFNAIIPPLALDGCLVSIRKFKKSKMPLSAYVNYGSMSPVMARFLEICGSIRLNMIISGGTGSGKTTLLNALSGPIDPGERIVTIEDAAELQLHQPHVLRLETRPASTEGKGEVTQRALLKNALRMRPDRIILGEIRGEEVVDVLAAMNTGHDGSMATIHANSPRDCMTRLENLVATSSVSINAESVRHQIASAVHLIVQIERMNDGKRRVTQIEEVVGIEGGRITSQTLFKFQIKGRQANGDLTGEYIGTSIKPHFLPQAEYFGKSEELLACFAPATGRSEI